MLNNTTEHTHAEMGQGKPFSFDDFIELATWFHNYPAPGLLLGGYMVEVAKRHIPEGLLFDAVSETSWCLPDAVQLLTPCTVGNGWLRIRNTGVYAVSLFDKHTGEGVRVRLDPSKLDDFPHTRCWLMKTKPKANQDSDALRKEIREHGPDMLDVQRVTVKPEVVTNAAREPLPFVPSVEMPFRNRTVRSAATALVRARMWTICLLRWSWISRSPFLRCRFRKASARQWPTT